MALMHVNFFSQVLGLSCSMDVILPQKLQGIGIEGSEKPETGYPVLWLLHGASDDHTIWQRRTSIERYVAPLGLAVVMPAVELSFYTNMEYGFRYFDYITEELPQICREFFPVSEKREDNYVAGLSMGGYGALKVGMTFPENYAAVGCFSAGNFIAGPRTNPAEPSGVDSPMKMVPRLVFGIEDETSVFQLSGLLGTRHDIFHLAEQAVMSGKPLPAVFHACGTEDFCLENARLTKDFFRGLPGNPFRYEYHEAPGAHTWEFWDEWVQKYLSWVMHSRKQGA